MIVSTSKKNADMLSSQETSQSLLQLRYIHIHSPHVFSSSKPDVLQPAHYAIWLPQCFDVFLRCKTFHLKKVTKNLLGYRSVLTEKKRTRTGAEG